MLHGIGGVGKTALASELVRLACEREPERVLVVARGQLSIEGFFGGLTGALRRHLLLSSVEGPALHAVELAARTDLPWSERLALLREHASWERNGRRARRRRGDGFPA